MTSLPIGDIPIHFKRRSWYMKGYRSSYPGDRCDFFHIHLHRLPLMINITFLLIISGLAWLLGGETSTLDIQHQSPHIKGFLVAQSVSQRAQVTAPQRSHRKAATQSLQDIKNNSRCLGKQQKQVSKAPPRQQREKAKCKGDTRTLQGKYINL